MTVVMKTFEVGGRYYVYDRNYDVIINLEESDYYSLKGNDSEKRNWIISKYQKRDFLSKSKLKRIEHPANHLIKQYGNSHVSQMILQLTQDCNLRCDYCFYVNPNYLGRNHAQKNMNFELAKKAMNYLIEHSSWKDKITLSFYGGEPLMRFDLIKECIEYMEENVEGREVTYSLTCNGTLLNSKMIEYFIDKNVDLLISLDGDKSSHDKHRVFPNGEGSFDIILGKVRKLKKKYPDYFENVFFNTVISPDMDFKCVREYYETDDVLGSTKYMATTLQDNYVDDTPKYGDNYFKDSDYGFFKVLLFFIGRLELKDIAVIYRSEINLIEKTINQLHSYFVLSEEGHHGGPCIAGSKRLFVDVAGNFYPCERVSENSEVMKIGNLTNGVEIDKVKNLINVGNVSKEQCLTCWAFNHCKICPASADDLTQLTNEKKRKECKQTKENVLSLFKDICIVRQFK